VQSLLRTISSACLKHIDLSYCQCNNDNFATNLAAVFLEKCPLQLETVNLSGCALTDLDCNILETFLSSCPLHQLTLSVNKLESKAGPSLARVVSSCQSLRVLNISGNPTFGNDGLGVLLPVIAQLQVLDVSSCGIVSPLPDDIAHLYPLSHVHSVNLHHLLLSGNRLYGSDRDIMATAWRALWTKKCKASCCLNNDAHFTLSVTQTHR
jgi:Ran GTPase-activating protein (RanGAP) involved in mRNA processing and transport